MTEQTLKQWGQQHPRLGEDTFDGRCPVHDVPLKTQADPEPGADATVVRAECPKVACGYTVMIVMTDES